MALLAAAALHALLAVLVLSKMSPPLAETRPMQVTLVQLSPRARPPPRSEPAPAAAPSSTPGPSAPKDLPRSSRPAAPATDWRVRPSDTPEGETARATLRARLGCRTADLLALTKDERAACQEALAKGAETAPTYAVISPKLKKVFDRTFECPKDDAWCEYRIGKAPYPGLFAPRKKKDPSWD